MSHDEENWKKFSSMSFSVMKIVGYDWKVGGFGLSERGVSDLQWVFYEIMACGFLCN